MVPFHIWLPEAHVEAPTLGSVLLAGILLKLGIFGLMRLSIPVFYLAAIKLSPWIMSFTGFGALYISFISLSQLDLKRVIAYSSVVHMNISILGLFALNFAGISGALLSSLSHSFVSAALFILIGFLYDRTRQRSLLYFRQLGSNLPLLGIMFFFFLLANMSIPLTAGFPGECLMLCGLFRLTFTLSIFGILVIGISVLFSLWLMHRIVFGNVSSFIFYKLKDLTLSEGILISNLFVLVFIFGIRPCFFIYLGRDTVLLLSTTLARTFILYY